MSADTRVVAFGYDGTVIRAVDRDPDDDGALWPAATEPFTSVVASNNTRSDGVGGWGRDPSLSGDGRILAFVVAGQLAESRFPVCTAPESCPGGPPSCGIGFCQIVARDLVVDRERAAAGLPPLPAHVVTQSDNNDCTADE